MDTLTFKRELPDYAITFHRAYLILYWRLYFPKIPKNVSNKCVWRRHKWLERPKQRPPLLRHENTPAPDVHICVADFLNGLLLQQTGDTLCWKEGGQREVIHRTAVAAFNVLHIKTSKGSVNNCFTPSLVRTAEGSTAKMSDHVMSLCAQLWNAFFKQMHKKKILKTMVAFIFMHYFIRLGCLKGKRILKWGRMRPKCHKDKTFMQTNWAAWTTSEQWSLPRCPAHIPALRVEFLAETGAKEETNYRNNS